MRKKLILFTITFAAVALLMLIYRLSTSELESKSQPDLPPVDKTASTDDQSPQVQSLDVGPVQLGTMKKGRFITRKNGRIVREFGFDRRMSGDNNMLILSKPWVAYYLEDGRILLITAERARVPVEADQGEVMMPKQGTLEGDVSLVVYTPGTDLLRQDLDIPSPGNSPIEWRVSMEQVDFQTEFSQMSSPGLVTVDSDQFHLKGRDLIIQYDQINKRLQELELRKLDHFELIRNDQNQWFASKTQKSTDTPKPKTNAANAEKKSKNDVYRMTLNDNVVLKQGTDVITADAIEIMTNISKDKTISSQTASTSKEIAKTPAPNGKAAIATDTPKPRQAQPQTTTITLAGEGPLRITVVDDETIDTSKEQLTFTATGRPVHLSRQGQSVIQAKTLHYDQASGDFQLEGSDQLPVQMAMSPEQWATANHVEIDSQTGIATLTGPGRVEYLQSDKSQTAKIEYANEILLHFNPGHNTGDRFSNIQWTQIDQLDFKGRLQALTDSGQILANNGKMTFYPPAPTAPDASGPENKTDTSKPILRSLELWDHVTAQGEQKSFSADSIVANFDPDGRGGSQISYMLAQGNVDIDEPNDHIYAGEKLELTFASGTDRHVPTSPTGQAEPSQSQMGIDQMFSGAKPSHIVAQGPGGNVRFRDKTQDITVVGDRIEGNALVDQWSIFGSPAVLTLADQGALKGRQIHFDRTTQVCNIVGSGQIVAAMNTDLTGTPLTEPQPMTINWTDGATYKMSGGCVQFEGVTAHIDQTRHDNRQSSNLTCRQLTIYLSQNDSKQQRINQNFAAPDHLDRLVASGEPQEPVRVKNIEYDSAGKELNQTTLLSRQLRYDQIEKQLTADGGGWVEFVNYRSASAETPQPDKAPESMAQKMDDVIGSNDPSYTLIRFGKQMQFNQQAATLNFTGQVALDHLPLTPDMPLDPDKINNIDGLRRLDCNELFIANQALALGSQKNDTRKQQVLEGVSAGLQTKPPVDADAQVSTAKGPIFFEAVENGRHHTFSGETLIYESRDNVVTITGTQSMPVYLDQMAFLRVRCHFDDKGIRLFDALPYGQSEISLNSF